MASYSPISQIPSDPDDETIIKKKNYPEPLPTELTNINIGDVYLNPPLTTDDLDYYIDISKIKSNLFDDISKANSVNEVPFVIDGIKYYLHNINNDNAVREPDGIKLSIFNIYDSQKFLNESYGSSYNVFNGCVFYYNNIINHFNLNKILFHYLDHTFVIDSIGILKFFFFDTSCKYESLILSFGSKYHGTCLYLKKIKNTELIKVIHINTGFGIKVDNVNYNNTTYHNIYQKCIYLKKEMLTAFMTFLKPYFYLKSFDINDRHHKYIYLICVVSDYIERLLNYKIDNKYMPLFYNSKFTDIEDYYFHIFKLLNFNNIETYNYLNDIFDTNNFNSRMNDLGISYTPEEELAIKADDVMFTANSIIFEKFWSNFTQPYIFKDTFNEKKNNYIKLAFENIGFYIHNSKLYTTTQVAGTCVFKSLLFSIIYHLIYENDEPTKPLITTSYLGLSAYCYEKINRYIHDGDKLISDYINQTVNVSKIFNKLISDKILSNDFSLINLINSNNKFYKKDIPIEYNINNIASINKSDFSVSTIQMVTLNDLLDSMRRATNPKILETINSMILLYVKNERYSDISRSNFELIFIGFLWELYNNQDKWEEKLNSLKYNYSNLLYLDLLLQTNHRLILTENEINWICKLYVYLSINYVEIKTTDCIKNIIDVESKLENMFPENDYIKTQIILRLNGLSICHNIKIINYKTTTTNYTIYNRDIDTYDRLDRSEIPKLINKHSIIQIAIILFTDYLFTKNHLQNDFNNKTNYLLDNDVSNLNRFIINYLKNPNSDLYINIERSFTILEENDIQYTNLLSINQNFDIKNLYVMEAFIYIYKIYCVYLTYDEKYRILKQYFINCKILTTSKNRDEPKLFTYIFILLNTILPDLYIGLSSDEYMVFTTGVYINDLKPTLLYDDEGTNKKKYIINNKHLKFFLYNEIIKLFENDQPIDKKSIDYFINAYEHNINSPYFRINKDNPSHKDLIIKDSVITDKFDKIDITSTSYLFGNILLNNNNNSVFINQARTYLVFVLYTHNYNLEKNKYISMKNDVIIALNIIPYLLSPNHFFLRRNMYINSNSAYLEYTNISNNNVINEEVSVNNYPFMIYGSDDSINIVEQKANNYILHCISTSNNEKKNMFHNIIYFNVDNYYIKYIIKQNFLTTIDNDYDKLLYCSNFYKIHSTRSIYINNFFNYNYIGKDDYDKKIKLYNLPNINLIDNEYIDNIEKDVINILDDILQTDEVPYIDLITWINNNTYNSIKPYDADLNCSLRCRLIVKQLFRDRIKHIYYKLIKLRKIISNKLIHSKQSYHSFLYDNYRYCSFIMQVNIYISSLDRLLNAIKNCEPVLCHELIEINQIFMKKTHSVSMLSGMVEIIFGNVIKNEQWDKILEIYNNYKTTNKWQVHQFMMGKGKSSIITPMLIVMLYFDNIKNNGKKMIYLIVPEHLKKQTNNTFAEYYNIFGTNIKILTDSEIKLQFLDNKIPISDSIILIDEFDFMYNPIQSNFNKIEHSIDLDPEYIEKVFNVVHSILFEEKEYPDGKPLSSITEIVSILKNTQNIKNVSFGMSNIDKNRYCIPYLRKDSPNEGSKFSSILYTIVLTMLYFYNPMKKKYILEEKDLIFAFNYKKLMNLLLKIYKIDTKSDIDTILHEYKRFNIDTIPSIPPEIMKLYILNVLNEFKESTIIKNCSFIDIINMDSVWQVGYSGTVNIDMDIEPLREYNKYDVKVIEDIDEKINVRKALTYYPEIHQIENADNVFDLFVDNNYNVLIDACALFKDYDNKEVAEKLYDIFNTRQISKTIIYLLKDDTKMIYNGKHSLYEEKIYKSESVVYYYSQRHTIGIDFKQPNILTGLVLLNSYNIKTDISQAIYRMRKLNKGHTIHIGYFNNNKPLITSEEIYKMITQNELEMNKRNRLLLLFQYLKYYIRKNFTKQYFEIDLKVYRSYDKSIEVLINEKFKHNVYNITANVDYILKGTGFINKETFPIRKEITKLLEMFKGSSKNDLLKLVFNTNSTHTEVAKETQVQTQVEQQIQTVKTFITNIKYSYIQLSIKFNPFKSIDYFIDNFIYQKIDFDNGYTLLFSYNLIKNISNYDSAIIVELADKVYMLDHSSLLNHYIYMKKVYTLNGKFINNFVFGETTTNINFEKMFNYILKTNDERVFDIGYILFGIVDETSDIMYPLNEQDIESDVMDNLDILLNVSNINIFKVRESTVFDIVKRNGKINYRHRLFNTDEAFINNFASYLEDYYSSVSRNKIIKDNNFIIEKIEGEKRTGFQYDLMFIIEDKLEKGYHTIDVQ
jgi:hypothetical protein